ncbi:RWD domain-containing protein [Escovopsis weberi]|uniref:RWD domain-containing protein n=1 Tax=Escovopsis weberi TaxID=150374 RepID=A0A0M8N5V7_ESCWE|nr:RWD domain-containing protein [Escovopsis weberi]
MGKEEQVEEREVLESIFPEEITGSSPSPELLIRPKTDLHTARESPEIHLTPGPDISETEFRIDVKLDLPGKPSDDSAEPPSFVLAVRYPDEYPDEAPHLDMLAPTTASASASAAPVPSHPHFSVGEDREALLAGLADTIQENLGIAMVFTLVSALKEAAEQLIQDREDAAQRVVEERAREAERRENAKFHGTPVTPETFLRWREGFLAEMEERRAREEEERLAELKKAKIREPVKLTGKQLWQQGLVGKVDEGDDEDGVLADGVEQLKVEG